MSVLSVQFVMTVHVLRMVSEVLFLLGVKCTIYTRTRTVNKGHNP